VLLVVARAVPEQIARLQSAAPDLRAANPQSRVLLVGGAEAELAALLVGLPIAGVLPLVDPDAGPLARLAAHRARRAFGVEAARIADQLARQATPHRAAAAPSMEVSA
jgi:hypothetical protein